MFPTGKLFVTTLLNLTPAAIGLAGSLFYLGRPYSSWLLWFLWIFYVLACYGSLKAWWIPYCFRPEPERAARDTALMGQRIFLADSKRHPAQHSACALLMSRLPPF
jgi:hypothetical protein